jgi:hypothetical protein
VLKRYEGKIQAESKRRRDAARPSSSVRVELALSPHSRLVSCGVNDGQLCDIRPTDECVRASALRGWKVEAPDFAFTNMLNSDGPRRRCKQCVGQTGRLELAGVESAAKLTNT